MLTCLNVLEFKVNIINPYIAKHNKICTLYMFHNQVGDKKKNSHREIYLWFKLNQPKSDYIYHFPNVYQPQGV